MKKLLFILIIILNLFEQPGVSQDKHLVDSLEIQLKNHNISRVELQIKPPSLYDTTAANILNKLSVAYWDNNPDKAMDYANQCLALSEQIGYKKGIRGAYNNMGVINYKKGNYLPALEFYKKALKINVEISSKQGIASSYNNIGNVYLDQGNYPEALKYYYAALKMNEESGNKKWQAYNLNNIGLIYKEQGNYQQALKNYFASLKIREEIGDKKHIHSSYNNIGSIYIDQGNYPEALKYHSAALKIQEEIGDKLGIALSYSNIGIIYQEQGNYSEALKNQLAALKIQEEIGDKKGIAASYGNIGVTFTEQKKYNDASEYLNKALSLSKEIGSLDDIKYSYSHLADLDSAQGNFKKALEHYKLYVANRDSLVNNENSEKIVALQMNYDFGKKQDSLAAVQDKKDVIAKAELQNQKFQKYAFIIGAILFLALAGLWFFRFREKRKALALLQQTQSQLVQSEKMASLGQLTAGIAHEINNPINFVSANINPLKRNFDELIAALKNSNSTLSSELSYTVEESHQLLSGIEEGSKRTAEIVKGLRNFSRLDENDLKEVNINEGIESTLVLVQNKMNERNIEVIESLGNIPQIGCYPGQLNQVWMNLLTNAIDAVGSDDHQKAGERKIFVTTSTENNHISISIRDTGKGMSDGVKQKIFDPFFTTKDVGKGTGLGLSISYGIIQKHNGKIEVRSEIGKGTEFIITLPVNHSS